MASEIIKWVYGRHTQNNYRTVAKRLAILALVAGLARNNEYISHTTIYHMPEFEYKGVEITATYITRALYQMESFGAVQADREGKAAKSLIGYYLNYPRLKELIIEVRDYIACLDDFIEKRIMTNATES